MDQNSTATIATLDLDVTGESGSPTTDTAEFLLTHGLNVRGFEVLTEQGPAGHPVVRFSGTPGEMALVQAAYDA